MEILSIKNTSGFGSGRASNYVPYKKVISNLEGNFEHYHKYGLIPSLLKFSDLHTLLIVVNTLIVTFK